ncbi:butyrophilin subfamily 2 member A1-like isoform X3 [Gallus gallus]|uniref:butyrophilin subfamily 2 member A1-like isoform X3 n=1 Tax=Gallus gallus TaxID=9031 RepID=UPI001AE2E3B5|nr:butyrophilin subfamily 2 member A1-like isoform X3 [Gallus gallus]
MGSSGSGSFPVQQLPDSLGARHVKRSEDPPQCSSKSFSNTSLFLCWTITSLRIITSLLTSVQNSLFIHFLRFVERLQELGEVCPPGFAYQSLPNLQGDGFWILARNDLVKGQFKIMPPNKPVVGVIGKGVVLPCQLEAKTVSERLLVQWIFTGKSPNIGVTTYDGINTLNPVREEKTYQGQTHFFQSEVNRGNLSLHLKNVMLSDKGKYICFVSLENWYDEVVVDLDVAAQGDESEVFLDGHVGQGIGLTCKSQGWFPQPEVIWLDSKGQTRKEKVVTQSLQTSSGLFDVVSSMTLEPGSDMEVSCRIASDLLHTACESRVLISDAFFPSTSPWMTAFLAITFCAVAVIAAIGYKLKINSTRKQKEETTRDDLIKKKEDLEKDLDAHEMVRIAGYSYMKHILGRTEPELDFWKAWDRAVPITVNPECQLLELQVPGGPHVEDNACEAASLSSPSTVPVLVAKEGFAAGKHYWEVDVDQQQDWMLGVMRHKGKQEEQGTLASEDYWALHRSRGVISSIEGNSKPEKKEMSETVIGVLLDLEEAQIFYFGTAWRNNMLKIPISFGKESAEMFYPFLSKGEGRFKPVCHQNIPVPLQIP